MTRVVHLVLGPAEHGVVRHGVAVALGCGHEVVRADTLAELPGVPACDVLHVPVTDRLFAPDIETARTRFAELAADVAASGATLSVTLHDVPHDDTPLQQRRLAFYREVVEAARGVVVNSDVELDFVTPMADGVHSLRRIPLPVDDVPPSGARPAPAGPPQVTVLGFVFPDRGYEDVIAALPADATLLALGRASDGHDDLPARYAELSGGRFTITGFVPDTELGRRLWSAAVPVAPNRRVTASASINTWIAHGRRPLVPDGPYSRELATSRPGCVWIYDADDPDELRDALGAALADPGRTWLGEAVPRGPSGDDVATAYRRHLASCAPPRAVPVGPGRCTVPGNRWDLLPPPTAQPTVSVVVPYFEAQRDLDLVLTALTAQTYPVERIEVVVVDDGSREPPDVTAAGPLAVQVLRQADEGFRAARARSLGAHAAAGELLAFLDGDTVPERGYLEALLGLPAACPDAVTVGRRRHADLSGVTPSDLPAWWSGALDVPVLTEPSWLVDAYRASGNLLRVDRRSYRFLISAVLALPAALFAEVGGFDERFVGYGGEDWELAHRLYAAGAVLAHVPSAVAWHDGPEWAERQGSVGAKDPETLTLATLLPDPDARGPGTWSPYPSIVVRAPALTEVQALATARSLFAAGVDAVLHLDAVDGPRAGLVLADPRIRVGPPAPDALARAWCVAEVTGPADLGGLTELADLADRHGEVCAPGVRVRSTRAMRRSERWGVDALAMFGGHDRSGPGVPGDVDLAARLNRR